jgi:hypothetical protein
MYGQPEKTLRAVTEVQILNLYVANCYSSGDWQLKQPTAVALPAVILKVGCVGCWSAGFLIRRVAG